MVAPLGSSAAKEVPSRYRVHLLPEPKPTERGVVYRRGPRRFLLAWSRIERAFAAQVGEPDGVRTIVFDLAIALSGPECVVCRLDAPPGEEARLLARAIEFGIGEERCGAELRAIAEIGFATTTYPDLDTFGEAALEAVRFQAAPR